MSLAKSSPQSPESSERRRFIEEEIRSFTATSPANRMPSDVAGVIFDEPLVGFADGDDPIFAEYGGVIAPTHLTPREALAMAYGKGPGDMPASLSVISWVMPITAKTCRSNRTQTLIPTRPWAYTRWHGEMFNNELRKHMVAVLTGMGYLAAAPLLQPYYKTAVNEKGEYSNWSERHVAYAAGLGTFSLSDGLITERGIAHRCGSVVTDLVLEPTPRTAEGPFSNCLFYVDRTCQACMERCPVGAITEKGHDKVRCASYQHEDINYLLKEYDVNNAGCGLCQTKVPCEFENPIRKASSKKAK